MKLKTYNAPTLHAALRLARIELGSEAVLLEAKEREAETAEGRFQVTFALGAGPFAAPPPQPAKVELPHWRSYLGETVPEPASVVEPEPEAAPEARPESQASPQPEPQPKPQARPEPRRRGPRQSKAAPKTPAQAPATAAFAHQPSPPSLPASLAALRTPELAALFGRLSAVGVTPADAATLTSLTAQAAGRDDDAAALETALRQTLDAGWRIHQVDEPHAKATRVIALVGPSGAGKSATAIKAASLLLRAYSRPVALISLGLHPIGGVEALESWSTLLNIRLEIVESSDRLGEALDRLTAGPRPPGAILIDTPADGSAAASLALAPDLETHLVVPAAYSPADLLRAAERYSAAGLAAAVLTRLDEAAAPGALWAFQRASRLPASYLGCGPETPDGLEPASAGRLTQRLLGR